MDAVHPGNLESFARWFPGYTGRMEFYATLDKLTKVIGGDDFKALQGKLTLSTAAADGTANDPEFNEFQWSIAA